MTLTVLTYNNTKQGIYVSTDDKTLFFASTETRLKLRCLRAQRKENCSEH